MLLAAFYLHDLSGVHMHCHPDVLTRTAWSVHLLEWRSVASRRLVGLLLVIVAVETTGAALRARRPFIALSADWRAIWNAMLFSLPFIAWKRSRRWHECKDRFFPGDRLASLGGVIAGLTAWSLGLLGASYGLLHLGSGRWEHTATDLWCAALYCVGICSTASLSAALPIALGLRRALAVVTTLMFLDLAGPVVTVIRYFFLYETKVFASMVAWSWATRS